MARCHIHGAQHADTYSRRACHPCSVGLSACFGVGPTTAVSMHSCVPTPRASFTEQDRAARRTWGFCGANRPARGFRIAAGLASARDPKLSCSAAGAICVRPPLGPAASSRRVDGRITGARSRFTQRDAWIALSTHARLISYYSATVLKRLTVLQQRSFPLSKFHSQSIGVICRSSSVQSVS